MIEEDYQTVLSFLLIVLETWSTEEVKQVCSAMEIPQSLLDALSISDNGGDNPSNTGKVKAPEKNKEISQKFRDEVRILRHQY